MFYVIFAVYTVNSMHIFWMLEIPGWLWTTVSHNQYLQPDLTAISTKSYELGRTNLYKLAIS